MAIRHETHFLKVFLRNMQQCTKRSSTFTCNFTPYKNILAYVRTFCWSSKTVLMSAPHSFMNFMQIERHKANADARSYILPFCW